jgi:hypothetical protein
MWFYNTYKNEMAKMNKAKPPQIAKELEKIDKKEAVDSRCNFLSLGDHYPLPKQNQRSPVGDDYDNYA